MMPKGAGITGRHVFFMLVAFFGVIIGANVIFVSIALKSFPGESQKKSYLQGLQYNATLTERAAQERLGWRAQIIRVERAGAGAIIEMRLSDARAQPLHVMVTDGDLQRPTHHREDQPIAFVALGDGVYRGELEVLAPGVWEFAAVATNARDEVFDIRARITIP